MRNRRAFTLIELLVVVAIIVALLAILLPSLNSAIAVSESAVCRSNLRQMQTAQFTFAADHKGSMFQHRSSTTTTGNDPENFWFGQLYRQMGAGEEQTMFCPTASELNPAPARGTFPGVGEATRAWGRPGVWSDFWISDFTGSYSYNAWLYDVSESPTLPAWWGSGEQYWQNITRLRQTSNVPVFVDGAWCETWPKHTDTANGNFNDPYDPWLSMDMGRVTMWRHPGGTVNGVMADGSARGLAMHELWTLKWHTTFDTTTGYDPE